MGQLNYEDLLYKRGYVITDAKLGSLPKGWIEKKLVDYILYYDPLNDVDYHVDGDYWVLLLGTAIDIDNNTNNKNFICKNLLSNLRNSEDNFFDYIDSISGRYVIMYRYKGTTKVLSDATGMKSIIYSTSRTIIASHINLVKEITNAEKSEMIKDRWIKEYSGFHFPGHFTPYEDIYFLTPNTFLDIEEKKVERFYPRKPLKTKDSLKVAKEITELVKGQMKVLSKDNEEFIFSLTAGIDSRTTLALFKDFISNTRLFTYYKVSKRYPNGIKSLEIDRKIVGEMVNNLNFNHSFIPLMEDERSNDFNNFSKIMKQNTLLPHSYKLAKCYIDNLPKETLHIRSNILEIGRSFYRGVVDLPEGVSAESLTKCYSPKAVEDKEILAIFASYYNIMQMENIYNYDPYDIFYWEYRMGVWHSQVLLESDVAHDTFIPFNCRRILELLLSVPDQDKQKNTVFKTIIDINWPVLNYWGINTLKSSHHNKESSKDNYGISLEHTEILSGSLFDKTKKVKYEVENHGGKIKFYMSKNNPDNGDFVEVQINLVTQNLDYHHCILQLRSTYENRKHTGRLKYQVFLNDNLILEEDIAHWKEINHVDIHFKPIDNVSKLRVKILSMKDCETWNWGKAGTIIIERVALRGSDKKQGHVAATSSYSNVYNL